MRALVVEYGSIAQRHLASLRVCGVTELLVLRDSAQRTGAVADATLVRDVADGVCRTPDFAVIASPSAAHVDSLIPLLGAGIPCYVEKPPVTSSRDVARLRDLLTSTKEPPATMTGCNLRFLPSLQRLRAAIAAGAIGTPVRASLQAGQWLPDWRPSRDYRTSYSARSNQGGGVILDLIHEIDAARWLFGEFERVHAFAGRLSRLEIETEDTACVLLAPLRGGPIVAISLDYVSRQRVRRYEVVGDEGTLVWDLGLMQLSLTGPKGTELLDSAPENFDVGATYLIAMRAFLAATRDGKAASPDLLDGLKTTELALKARSQS